MQVVVFKLKDEEFGVETSKVQNIGDNMSITRVPKSPAFIKGLVNLRGNVITLLDINLLLGIDNDNESTNTIILKLEEEEIGITVDEVKEVLEVDENVIERNSVEDENSYIKGILNFKDRIVTLIDVAELL
ncbi:putative chemotaxis protein [Clostridium bornimense]|uniref:Putative chemotaxis protein n=1 Tax=Clostridium bornimense TaxID=1216932 RepID=W6RVI4_9CLOT|nr:chemotaxis protein CheW [Clostridium bornimense]CDM68701.1 putative chemotaxis protein [Clostridium bornimense]